jgi:hypothetical protein
MIGNKAGINDSIEERGIAPLSRARAPTAGERFAIVDKNRRNAKVSFGCDCIAK